MMVTHSRNSSGTTCSGVGGGGMFARLKHVNYHESVTSRCVAKRTSIVIMRTDVRKNQPVSESRKVRKPLMEKKRRARINDSLETLKQILLESKTTVKESRGKNGHRTAKLEKADILEMTVSYLQQLHTKLNELKEQNCKIVTNQSPDSCVTLIPTKLSSGEVVYFLPSNLESTKREVNFQKKDLETLRPVMAESVWRPW